MTSLCGYVKALIGEWAIERMGEKHQNEEREGLCQCFSVYVHVPLSLFSISNSVQTYKPNFIGFGVYLK